MRVARIRLKNWRNFKRVDVPLQERQFLIGPNASGKSNFLDAFRFLRDIARPDGGGIQKAVADRGGLSKLRCLAARTDTEVLISVDLIGDGEQPDQWTYEIGLKQRPRGHRELYVSNENVWRNGKHIINRPNDSDNQDEVRLTQSFLEQVNENKQFRDLAYFFEGVTYLHLVPQLLRHADELQGRVLEADPFGQGLLERIARTTKRSRAARLRRIEKALKSALPQLQELQFENDPDTGRPHLAALYSHWRPKAGWQREDQFSDGTLRLIGLLWSLDEAESLLLLEEPELSLNAGIVSRLAPLVYRMQKNRRRQVLISTHSYDLLSDTGVSPEEVLFLEPSAEGTAVTPLSQINEVRRLMDAGLTAGEVALPRAAPKQLSLFEY